MFLNFYYDLPKSLRKLQQTVYTFSEYALFSYIFWVNIKKPKIRLVILSLSVLFLCSQVYYFLAPKTQKIDSIPVGVETILIFLYTFIYFSQYFKLSRNIYVFNDPIFWIVVGILLYLGSNFFFNILVNQINQQLNDQYWYLTFIPEIIKNILFVVGIILFHRRPDESTNKQRSNVPYLDMI